MIPLSLDCARELIDFAGKAGERSRSLADSQLEGAVAAYNMLARNKVAYIADEVGMGKTYIALGVMGLLRHLNPAARIMVIAPRENIQRKWEKELRNFVRFNWKHPDNRVKSIQGTPARKVVRINSTVELARAAALCDSHDLYLRMSSFSISAKQAEDRKRHRDRLLDALPAIDRHWFQSKDVDRFRALYGMALNFALPELDLLVLDEGHNLKHGFGSHVSTRNQIMAYAFGGIEPPERCKWYGPKVARVLLLSATPFEYDYGDIARQLQVLGFSKATLRDHDGRDPRLISDLLDPALDEDHKRSLVGRMLIRRVFQLKIGEHLLTKNLYRREWRNGGYAQHDDPLKLTDTRERLIVALMQKKVSEVLGNKRFNNHFQIGMLSSFESFLETVAHRTRAVSTDSNGEGEIEQNGDGERVFDGDQEATSDERLGVDSHSLATVVRSYRRRFGRSLPHPKLDATAKALANCFATGEKALIFVRRIATVAELKEKLDLVFNEWLRSRMVQALPDLRDELGKLFQQYEAERSAARPARLVVQANGLEMEGLRGIYEEDRGGTDTFFAWFFRGEGPTGVLSGAAFQKNRLASDSSAYATLFEDDHVSWLLGRPADVVGALADRLAKPRDVLVSELRNKAFARFRARTRRRKGYPRFYVFEAYQIAALEMLAKETTLGQKAQIVLAERYDRAGPDGEKAPPQFPGPESGLGIVTFITELVKHPALRGNLWPDEPDADFAPHFRRREHRRELLSAMCRLGASYIDLYLLAIRQLGSFALAERAGRRAEADRPEEELARGFIAVLEQQSGASGFDAYHELAAAAKAFDTILSVNFHEAEAAPLKKSAEVFGRSLQHQVPVAGMSGAVNKRVVTQFRMPGFPLVLATTDVLQEGEDLHTFCRRVIHYGITWTPSALEQRTGRVDRIGSLLQRTLEAHAELTGDDQLIQVHYPHLRDTVEVLQVRRVLERLNTFLKLIHRSRPEDNCNESRLNMEREMLKSIGTVVQLREPLESAFPISTEWLHGRAEVENCAIDAMPLRSLLAELWTAFRSVYMVEELLVPSGFACEGVLSICDGEPVRRERAVVSEDKRSQSFRLELRSQANGDATLLRCTSLVGLIDLFDDERLDQLYELQKQLDQPKVCAELDSRWRQHRVWIEGDLLFHPDTIQYSEVERLILRVAQAADSMEQAIFGSDRSWNDQRENEDEERA